MRALFVGGNVDNSTNLNIDAGGGTAIGDASGGNDNLAAAYGNFIPTAGGGGVSRSSADGGIVVSAASQGLISCRSKEGNSAHDPVLSYHDKETKRRPHGGSARADVGRPACFRKRR